MAKPEPERDEDGYLPDETVFKVQGHVPQWLRVILVPISICFSGLLTLSLFEVIEPPFWAKMILVLGMVTLVAYAYWTHQADLAAQENSPDHALGALERAEEALKARNRLYRIYVDVTDWMERRRWVVTGLIVIAIMAFTTVSDFIGQATS